MPRIVHGQPTQRRNAYRPASYRGVSVQGIRGSWQEGSYRVDDRETYTSPGISPLPDGEYQTKQESSIRGTGYVVESLEAALWCFWTTTSFEEAILKAANLGNDADTTAAVCGQVAGAFYGESGIPSHWLERLVMRQEIKHLAKGLYQNNHPG